jgi:hypothetical protein
MPPSSYPPFGASLEPVAGVEPASTVYEAVACLPNPALAGMGRALERFLTHSLGRVPCDRPTAKRLAHAVPAAPAV